MISSLSTSFALFALSTTPGLFLAMLSIMLLMAGRSSMAVEDEPLGLDAVTA